MLKRIGGVFTLRIQDGHGRRQYLVGHMMIADDEVYAEFLGICYLFYGLDATVEHYNQFDTGLLGIFYSLSADAITLFLAVGDVVVDIGIELLQEFIDQCYRRTPVDVVVAIYHDALFAPHGVVQTVYRDVHVIHQEGVYQLVEHRTEEAFCRTFRLGATLYEQTGQDRTHPNLLGQFPSRLLLLWCRWFVIPFKQHLRVL